MALTRYVVKMGNTNVDASNQQLMGFVAITGSGLTSAVLTAYVAACSTYMGAGTFIDGISFRDAGQGGATDIVWAEIQDQYDVLRTSPAGAAFNLPVLTDWGQALRGRGGLSPLGSSISVSELTSTPGRTGRGRHFLPYTNGFCLNAGGKLDAGAQAVLSDAARYYLGNQPIAGFAPHTSGGVEANTAQLAPGTVTVGKPILNFKPQPTLSNLRTRRR